jgi:hypothetical protein
MAHRRRDDGGRGQAPQARCLPAAALGAAVLLGLTACAAGPNGGVRHADGAAAGASIDEGDRWAEARERMVRTQIEARGVRDPRVLDAMRTVPRHEFVAEGYEARAYDDTPLPIAAGQTISQPYIVAVMSEAADIQPHEVVLEIGTGSGQPA